MKVKNLRKLAVALDISTNYLFFESSQDKNYEKFAYCYPHCQMIYKRSLIRL